VAITKKMAYKPNTGQSIDRIYAWIAVEPDGGEGILSAQIGEVHMPLVGADKERIESLREYAKMIHLKTLYPIKLVVFETKTILEEL
jgi:hypothetical protein